MFSKIAAYVLIGTLSSGGISAEFESREACMTARGQILDAAAQMPEGLRRTDLACYSMRTGRRNERREMREKVIEGVREALEEMQERQDDAGDWLAPPPKAKAFRDGAGDFDTMPELRPDIWMQKRERRLPVMPGAGADAWRGGWSVSQEQPRERHAPGARRPAETGSAKGVFEEDPGREIEKEALERFHGAVDGWPKRGTGR